MVVLLDGTAKDKKLPVNEFAGETMHYKMKYGIFNIGVATISCLEYPSGCGCILKAQAPSSGLPEIFRSLDYRFDCCMDPATGLPNSAIMDLKDGKNTAYNKVRFDHYSRMDSVIIISETGGEFIVPKNIYDLLTGYYYFRKNHLIESINNGLPVVILTFISDMLWDLKLTYTGGETITTMHGKVPCMRFISSTVEGGFFRGDNDMTVWFTKDEIPVPVKIQLDLKIGSIKGELESYQMPIGNLSPK